MAILSKLQDNEAVDHRRPEADRDQDQAGRRGPQGAETGRHDLPDRARRTEHRRAGQDRTCRPATSAGVEVHAGLAVQRLHGAAAEATGADPGRPGGIAQAAEVEVSRRGASARSMQPQPRAERSSWIMANATEPSKTRGPEAGAAPDHPAPAGHREGHAPVDQRASATPTRSRSTCGRTRRRSRRAVEELFGVRVAEGAHAESARQEAPLSLQASAGCRNWKKAIVTLHADRPGSSSSKTDCESASAQQNDACTEPR